MKKRTYTINPLYDISEEVLQEKIKSLNPIKDNPELTPDEINDYPHLGEEEGMTLADIRLEDFVKEGVVSNVTELDNWLSSCLNREDLVSVITNFDLFGPRTRSIALSNPLCYYDLLKEVVINENDNWEKLEIEVAKTNIKDRESGFIPLNVDALSLDIYKNEAKVLTIDTPARIEDIIISPNNEGIKYELKDNYELIISCDVVGEYSISITASKEGFKDSTITIPINVKEIQLTDISIDLEDIIVREQSTTVVDVNTLATNLQVRIDNENKAVATVEGKRVTITGIAYGSCKLIITGQAEGYRENTVEFPVTVEQLPATQITVDNPEVSINQLREFVVNVTTEAPDINVEINEPQFIDVEKNGKALTIKAKEIGETYFLIKGTADGFREGVTTVRVTVVDKLATELEVSPTEEVSFTEENEQIYNITRTNATEVQAEVDVPDVASVTVNGIENIKVAVNKPYTGPITLTIRATADKCKETVITRIINAAIQEITTLIVEDTNPRVTVEKEIVIPVNTNASTFNFRITNSELATGIVEDKNLKITGVGTGTTEITLEAQAENMRPNTLVLNLTIEEKPLTEITTDWIDEPLEIGKSKNITVTTPAADFEVLLDNGQILGMSKDGKVISIEGLKPGSCKISIKATQDAEHRENTLDINVQVQESTQLSTTPESFSDLTIEQNIEVIVETDADDFNVSSKNNKINLEKLAGKKFSVTGREVGEDEIEINAKAENKLQTNKKLSIRIIEAPIPETELTLTSENVTVKMGQPDAEVTATTNAASITAESKNTDKATVSVEGLVVKIKPVAEGTGTIEVKATAEDSKETVKVINFTIQAADTVQEV